MSDDKGFPQEQSAYTAPAENGGYQFCSRLNDGDREPQPKREKKPRSAVGPVIAGVLILLAAGAAFCVLILQITLSVHYDENGFSVELVRKSKGNPIVRMEEPVQVSPASQTPVLSTEQDRYEWTGETLRMSADGQGDDLSFRQLYAEGAYQTPLYADLL